MCHLRSIITLLTIHLTTAYISQNKFPLWSWDCINDKCVPNKATHEGKLQTLETCNMLCSSMQLWPQPTGSVSLSTTAVPVRSDFFELRVVSCPSRSVRDFLRKAFKVFKEELRKSEKGISTSEECRRVTVRVAINGNGSVDPRLRLDTDESYRLRLRPKTNTETILVNISSNSFCGARHAIETLSQLVWLDSYAGSLMMLEAATVDDAPRFHYRGILIDTARNYFPVSELLRTIDGMAASKLNTFHWHATDSQAFSLQLSSVPQLSRYGAYGPGAVYTQEDVRTIAHYARIRGVRILLEVDLPSHVGSAWDWGPEIGLHELAYCVQAKPWNAYCKEPPCGQINPRNPYVYDLIERIYSDIIRLTGVDDIFHLGGDDVSDRCWKEHLNSTDVIDLWVEFTSKALRRLENVNGKLPNLTILWNSHLSERIKTDLKMFVHHLGLQARNVAWSLQYVTGIRTIISHEDAWDLNSGYGAWYEESEGPPYNSWQRIYEHRPWARNNINLMEGGEVTVWSSSLSAGGLDPQIWPRAAAFAERLWSDRPESATRPVHARLDVHRSRLIARGIRAAPLWSMWCTHNPFTC